MSITTSKTKEKCRSESASITDRLAYMHYELNEALHPTSRARLWLLSSIERNMRAYGLVDMDAWDILIEAYIRANRFVSKGGLIWNVVSWLKSASVVIIYEQRRKLNKLDILYFPNLQGIQVTDDIPTDEMVDASNLALILEIALNQLKREDRELLSWKVGHNYSWGRIQKILHTRGESVPNLATLRKRKQRAIKRFRDAAWEVGLRRPKLSDRELTLTSRFFSRRTLQNPQNQ